MGIIVNANRGGLGTRLAINNLPQIVIFICYMAMLCCTSVHTFIQVLELLREALKLFKENAVDAR